MYIEYKDHYLKSLLYSSYFIQNNYLLNLFITVYSFCNLWLEPDLEKNSFKYSIWKLRAENLLSSAAANHQTTHAQNIHEWLHCSKKILSNFSKRIWPVLTVHCTLYSTRSLIWTLFKAVLWSRIDLFRILLMLLKIIGNY